jgi:hypothetical protein
MRIDFQTVTKYVKLQAHLTLNRIPSKRLRKRLFLKAKFENRNSSIYSLQLQFAFIRVKKFAITQTQLSL